MHSDIAALVFAWRSSASIAGMEISEQELARQFAAMEDENLLGHAADRHNLTQLARTVLLQEVKRRHLPLPEAESQPVLEFEPQTWVTVARFRDLSSAIVARSALEAADLLCYLRDENLVRMDWQISNFIGGMRLDVLSADLATAQEVLAGLPADEEPASDTGAALSSDKCLQCGSTNIRREARRLGWSLAALLLMSVPLPAGPSEWRCGNCGARWQDE